MQSRSNRKYDKKKVKAQLLIASGGVIFRKNEGLLEVALCFKKREKVWCLPKGLIEKGETAEEAALREVKEETGLEGEIITKIGEVKYAFFKKKRYFKKVHFYLLRCVGGSVDNHDFEVEEVRWFPISEAFQVLAYANERKILKKTKTMLETFEF